jgi:hypothetical protein
MNSNKPVQTIKVKPYPFRVQITGGAVPFEGWILKLVKAGFLANVGDQILHLGHHFDAAFEIPVSHHVIRAPVRVRKTYDRPVPGGKGPQRIVEFSFETLNEDQVNRIYSFLHAIHQEEL